MTDRLRFVVLSALALAACQGKDAGTATVADRGDQGDPGDSVTHKGELDDGAAWIAELPANWNGTLLLYSHGYSRELRPPESAPESIAPTLLDSGYALAASSYPTAEWALAEAVPSQVLVLDAFSRRFGKPKRVIAWGSSMGGLVTSALAERHADLIDGGLTMCASNMGAVPMMNMAFDGALALATLIPAQPAVDIVGQGDNPEGIGRQLAAVEAVRDSAEGRARIALAGILGGIPSWTRPDEPRPSDADYRAQADEIAAAARWGFFLPRGNQELRAGGVYSWNTGIDYSRLLEFSGRAELARALYVEAGLDLDADIGRLNAVRRVVADNAAVDYMLAHYTPTGDIGVPVLSLHTIGDGMTSPSLQASYVDKIRAAGKGDLVAALWIERAGHCTQTAAEMQVAIGILETRIESGRWRTDTALAQSRDAGDGVHGGDIRFIDYSAPRVPRIAAGYDERKP